MATLRKSFEGVQNVVRFNWHFYVLALAFALSICVFGSFLSDNWFFGCCFVAALICFFVLLSLAVTHYVYDRSDLYKLNWLNKFAVSKNLNIATINAGFDETSHLLADKLQPSKLFVLDFYDPKLHTEVSIKRAQKKYPPHPATIKISFNKIPISQSSIEMAFAILSVHEIRNHYERATFLLELSRILKDEGKIFIVEHLRDLPNFLAYYVGFFHFLSEGTWRKTFNDAELRVLEKIKITPFITAFILTKR